MKLQLDTTNKTIKLESSINLGELVKSLEKLLPKGEWKDFTLETNTVINNWNSPFVVERIREVPVYPRWDRLPWYSSGVSYMASSSNADMKVTGKALGLKSGTYNVEL